MYSTVVYKVIEVLIASWSVNVWKTNLVITGKEYSKSLLNYFRNVALSSSSLFSIWIC